jgi:hypothetical protein
MKPPIKKAAPDMVVSGAGGDGKNHSKRSFSYPNSTRNVDLTQVPAAWLLEELYRRRDIYAQMAQPMDWGEA